MLGSVDCFAFSTTASEGFGIVLIEAMAAGLPIIATNTGGIPSVLGDDPAGILIPPQSPTSIRSAIEQLISDDSKAQELQQQGMKRAQRFSVPSGIDTLENFYRTIIASRSETNQ